MANRENTRIVNSYGSPVQSALTLDSADYTGMNLTRCVLGVILEVFPADNEQNRSSFQREDRRGYLHTATVLVIQDGKGAYTPLENVIIPPRCPSGIDDYSEKLPRGCTTTVTGQAFNNQLNHINPYDLDGDWCVVDFLGGSIDQPFISSWWPHPANTYDPATSGQSNPNNPNQPNTLVQNGRYFERINGVEFTITKSGHLYISTHRASSTLNYGDPLSPIEGRFPRTLNADTGGSIRAWVKASQSLEIDFNEPIDGIGTEDIADFELPQTNPGGQNRSDGSKVNTYCKYTKDRIQITVPDELSLKSKRRLLLSSDEDTRLTVGNDFHLDVTGDTIVSSTGPASITAQQTLDITAAQLTAQADTITISGSSIEINSEGTIPSTVGISPAGITMGSGALGGVVGGLPLAAAFNAFQAAVAAAALTATFDTTAWTDLSAAALALSEAIAGTASSTTLVG